MLTSNHHQDQEPESRDSKKQEKGEEWAYVGMALLVPTLN